MFKILTTKRFKNKLIKIINNNSEFKTKFEKILDFFKKKNKPKLTNIQRIKRLVEYLPDYYKSERQYIHCVEFIKYYEWGLALESLVELAGETEHFFSEEFWSEIGDIAYQFNKFELSKYCFNQIKRNELELKLKIPFGNTIEKLDELTYQHYTAKKINDEWTNKRHLKDKVHKLINKDGIYLKMKGRSGTIYYVLNNKVAEIYIELGMNGLILYFYNLTNWILPVTEMLSDVEKQNIKDDIIKWSIKKNHIIYIED